jgi:hypothetical protein
MQELIAEAKKHLAFWTSPGKAEVDFVLEYKGKIYPLEVKAGTDKNKRSLNIYSQKYASPLLFRASRRKFIKDDKVLNYPLYLISKFPEI